jgi:hypothetical protein
MSEDKITSAGDSASQELTKPSQAEAIKRILEKKKQAQRQANSQQGNNAMGGKQMKTQIHKVQNNQKRRTGV